MALGLAYILVGIPIALLGIYGIDVIVTELAGEGFLPIDHRARGIGLGLPGIILPFAAFVVARKQASVGLGAMLVVVGVLIIAGGLAVIGLADPPEMSDTRNAAAEALPLIAVGSVIIGLGVFKIRRSQS